MSIKILAAGDLHLGRQSSSFTGEASIKSTKYVWEKMVDYAINNQIDIIALPGDIVDEDNRYFEATSALQQGFSKLKQHDIQVIMIAGNHDFEVLPQITQVVAGEDSNVQLIGQGAKWEKYIYTNSSGEQIQFVGWSFNRRHITENPLHDFSGLELDSNLITIGLLHGDVDTSGSEYAPTTKNDFIQTSGKVQAWILGHIHQPPNQVLVESNPRVFYTGSPQAMNPVEKGKHGPVLITVTSKEQIDYTPIWLSPIRYEVIDIDISGCEDANSVRNKITSSIYENNSKIEEDLEEAKYLIYDLNLRGKIKNINQLPTWIAEIEDPEKGIRNEDLFNISEVEVRIRKIYSEVQIQVSDMESLAKEKSPIGHIARTIIEIEKGEESDFIREIIENWRKREEENNRRTFFHGLVRENRLKPMEDDEIKQLIAEECNHILSELIVKQNG